MTVVSHATLPSSVGQAAIITNPQYYVDAAYCYRRSSVVCRSLCHNSEPCKMAELIEIPFGLRTRVGPENHVLHWGQDPLWEGAILKGEGAAHCKV